MASFAIMIAGAAINALAFSGSNYLFSSLRKKGADEERKRHDKAVEDLQKAQSEWSKERISKLDFYNKFLQDEKDSAQYFSDVNDAAQEYYLATGKKQKQFRSEPQKSSDYYHPSEYQQNAEYAFIIGGLGIVGFITYKYV